MKNQGFPKVVWGGLSLLAVFFFVASVLTSDWIVLWGRDTQGRIVELSTRRRMTWVTIEYPGERGEVVRSARSSFNYNEIADLAEKVGRSDPEYGYDPRAMIGAVVPVRYARGNPRLAHIRGWVPLYREFAAAQAAWIVCALFAGLAFKYRK